MKNKKIKVSIIGLGYVGLPTLTAISLTGKYEVVGFDIDRQKIQKLRQKQSPILDEFVQKNIKKINFTVSDDENILKDSKFFIIAVPTPIFDDYTPNYNFLINAFETVLKFIKKHSHIIIESTVNPGAIEEVLLPLTKNLKLKPGVDFNIAHCPERINPGDKKYNILNINRNIGSLSKKYEDEAVEFYKSFITKANIYKTSDIKTAEASKIVENAFRDINIAFVNELAKSFDKLEIDITEVIRASSNKPFGFMPHFPGCGVGGHCIAVDPYYLINKAKKVGFSHEFLLLARKINNSMPFYTVNKLIYGLNELEKPIKQTSITLLGLSYKKNIKDTRQSPSLKIKKRLIELGADLTVYDPFITPDKDFYKSIKNSFALVIATDHDKFYELYKLLPKTKVKLIVDGKNMLDKQKILNMNIKYIGIGR